MYRLEIYQSGDLVSVLHGNLDDLAFVIDNLKWSITLRFKITSL